MSAPATPLDQAHAAMAAAPEDPAARLRFYDRLAAAELVLLLEAEPEGEEIRPALFELEDGPVVLAFDREERLAAFAEGPAPYAALPGRALAAMLAGQGIGVGLNLDVAPSSILLPAEAIGWLAETAAAAPAEIEARPEALYPPGGLPEGLLEALDARLAAAAGLARAAYLAQVECAGGGSGHMLAFLGTREGAEPALARAAAEALAFSGVEAGWLDVAFLADADPLAARLATCALRFDLPEPAPADRHAPRPPGSDPDAPPRLR